MTKFYYIIFSQQDFCENEVLEETLRERSFYYMNRTMAVDFRIIISPDLIQDKDISQRLKSTYFFMSKSEDLRKGSDPYFYTVVLATTNNFFVDWLKLRFGYFEDLPLLEDCFPPRCAIFPMTQPSTAVLGVLETDDEPEALLAALYSPNPQMIHPVFLQRKIKDICEEFP